MITLAVILAVFVLAVLAWVFIYTWFVANELADDCSQAMGRQRGRHRLPRNRTETVRGGDL